MSKSDYLENELLDHIFGNSAWSPPATFYVALATAAITDTDTGSTITEPSGNDGYARKAVTNNTTEFPAASSSQKQNANAITFADATGSWGTVTHWAIVDAATAGNILYFGALTTSKTIEDGDTPRIKANELTITED